MKVVSVSQAHATRLGCLGVFISTTSAISTVQALECGCIFTSILLYYQIKYSRQTELSMHELGSAHAGHREG